MDIKVETGFIDTRTGRGSITAALVGTPANYWSIGAMRTRLTAISGTTFTAARLDAMTENDMVFALRNNDDPTSIR